MLRNSREKGKRHSTSTKAHPVNCFEGMDEIGSRLYCCFRCHNLIANQDDIINKDFLAGQRRRAFLFSRTKNLEEGTPGDRSMITGIHTVAQVSCKDCGEGLGWKYCKAYDEQNMYKVGKTVLEISKIEKLVKPPFR